MKSISFVMPALNEREGIVATIESIPLEKLEQMGYEVEIIVVDGGSEDETAHLARKAGARIIFSPRGYGRQYKNGFKEARGEIIITGDSDGTYPFDHVPFYIKQLESRGLDFVTVNRFAHMEPGAMHFTNKIGNFGLTLFTNILFGLRLKDSQSGMWIFKREALSKIKLRSDGMPFSQELKIESFAKLRSLEIDGSYRERLGNTKLMKLRDGWGNLKALFEKRFIVKDAEF
ncbi:MAG TPA: glycosyltransferase family 2 protein [Candidatus Nanoarchaeia archaeon]|nr:glycosyltransferase family 2 protein [Candidatus Nanoarchaeia archaeon]